MTIICALCKKTHKEDYVLCKICREYLNNRRKTSIPEKKQEYDKKYRQKLKKERYDNILEIIKSNEGICFTDYETFENDICIKFKLKCKNGHFFELVTKKLEQKFWCPICSQFLGEYISIQAIEYLTGEKFIKTHPKWLGGLELDGYNESIKMALEYNGQQHYTYVPLFHQGDYTFKRQKKNDKLKINKCNEKGIDLIIVPYTIKNEDICFYIFDILENIIGFNCVNNSKNFSYKISNRRIDDILNIIKKKEGTLINPFIKSCHDYIEIKCKEGHIFKIKAKYLKDNRWCFECIKDNKFENISSNLLKYYQTEEGKVNKKKALEKRSETMKKIREEKRKTITTKLCNSCGDVNGPIDISNFNKKNNAADGLQTNCKDCVRIKKQERREKQNNGLSVFKCEHCSCSYKLKDSLIRHMKEKHIKN